MVHGLETIKALNNEAAMLSPLEQAEYLAMFKRALKDLSTSAADLKDIMKKVASRMDADLRSVIVALDKTEEKYSDFALDIGDAIVDLHPKIEAE